MAHNKSPQTSKASQFKSRKLATEFLKRDFPRTMDVSITRSKYKPMIRRRKPQETRNRRQSQEMWLKILLNKTWANQSRQWCKQAAQNQSIMKLKMDVHQSNQRIQVGQGQNWTPNRQENRKCLRRNKQSKMLKKIWPKREPRCLPRTTFKSIAIPRRILQSALWV